MLTRIYFTLILAALAAGCSAMPTGPRTVASHARWEAMQGGMLAAGPACDRAAAALQQVAGDLPATGVHAALAVHVLKAEFPTAFSFPDGAIYVSRGLVGKLTDEELAAAIAHELGHLLHAGVIEAPAMLRGTTGANQDIEQTADLLGRQLLLSHHLRTEALPAALEKVATASKGCGDCAAIEARAKYLRELDRAAQH